MKIVDLKCPSCGGKLIPVEGNSKIVKCEYCNNQYVLEDDRVINYHIHQYGEPEKPAYTDNPPAKWALAAVPAIVIAGVMIIAAVMGNKKETVRPTIAVPFSYTTGGTSTQTGTANVTEAETSPLYEVMLQAIFDKPADSVTAKELEGIRYLRVQTGLEVDVVEYSFDDPYETENFRTETFQTPALEWNLKDLSSFTGLVKVDIGHERSGLEVLGKLPGLKGLCCYRVPISELTRVVNPEQLIELDMEQTESLDGIADFVNLEQLTLDGIAMPDFKQLVALKNLKSLWVKESGINKDSNTLTDYSALSVLTSLEALHLDSEAIREFSFLKPLSNLTVLSIEGTEAIGVEPLGELTQLTSLTLEDNNAVSDYGPVGTLTGLRVLSIDKSTSSPDPDLSSLSNLEDLEISGFLSVSFLKNMGNLKNLSIHGCNMDEAQALSKLTGLESLSCYSVWTSEHALKSLNFIDGMANLKRLCLCNRNANDSFGGYGNNVEIYGDISNVLNHQGLEEVYLDHCLFGLSFDRIGENASLKILHMNDVSIKENFYVESSGGMTNVWYDEVSFDENTEFLSCFPNLEELSLNENQLTNIAFASSLKQLHSFSIMDNYVTDLTPLNQIEDLRYLDIRKNPVGSVPEGEDGMMILK